MAHDPRAMALTPLVAVSRPDLNRGQRWALAGAMTLLLVPLGVFPAIAAVNVLRTPVSAIWFTLIPTVGIGLLTTYACAMAWRGVALGARHARRYELLYGDRIVGHDGRSRDDHVLLLHDPRVHVVARYDHLARSRYVVTRPRMLTELVAPTADGRRAGRLLLDDVPHRIVARDTDVPRQRRPDHELAAIAAVLRVSPHPAGAQAANHVSALIGT